MSIRLLILVIIAKVKVVRWLEYALFVDVLHRKKGGVLLRPQQQNTFLFRGRFSTGIGTVHVSHAENRKSPQNRSF